MFFLKSLEAFAYSSYHVNLSRPQIQAQNLQGLGKAGRGMTNPIRLDLFPDLEAPEWTRLREIVGTIITVQDLPETLRRRLIPFVRTLAEAGVEHLNYRGEDAPEGWIDRQRMNIARYARNPPHILQVIET